MKKSNLDHIEPNISRAYGQISPGKFKLKGFPENLALIVITASALFAREYASVREYIGEEIVECIERKLNLNNDHPSIWKDHPVNNPVLIEKEIVKKVILECLDE